MWAIKFDVFFLKEFQNEKLDISEERKYAITNAEPCPEVIKLFFLLNSAEHEILNAHKYKNIKKLSILRVI